MPFLSIVKDRTRKAFFATQQFYERCLKVDAGRIQPTSNSLNGTGAFNNISSSAGTATISDGGLTSNLTSSDDLEAFIRAGASLGLDCTPLSDSSLPANSTQPANYTTPANYTAAIMQERNVFDTFCQAFSQPFRVFLDIFALLHAPFTQLPAPNRTIVIGISVAILAAVIFGLGLLLGTYRSQSRISVRRTSAAGQTRR